MEFETFFAQLQQEACSRGHQHQAEGQARLAKLKRCTRVFAVAAHQGQPWPYPFGPLPSSAGQAALQRHDWPTEMRPTDHQRLGTVLRWMELSLPWEKEEGLCVHADLAQFGQHARGKSPWSWDLVSLAHGMHALCAHLQPAPTAEQRGTPQAILYTDLMNMDRITWARWLSLMALAAEFRLSLAASPQQGTQARSPRPMAFQRRVADLWEYLDNKRMSRPLPVADTAPSPEDLPQAVAGGQSRRTARLGSRRLLAAYFVRVLLHHLALSPKEWGEDLLPGVLEILQRWVVTEPSHPLAPPAALMAMELRALQGRMKEDKDKDEQKHWPANASPETRDGPWLESLFNPTCISLNTDPQEVQDWFGLHLPQSACPAEALHTLARQVAEALTDPTHYALLFGSLQRRDAHPAKRLVPDDLALNNRWRRPRVAARTGADDWAVLALRRKAVFTAFARQTGWLARQPSSAVGGPQREGHATFFRQAMAEAQLQPLAELRADTLVTGQEGAP